MNPTRRSFLKWSGIALASSPVVGLLTLSISGPSLLEKQREAARREGIPLTPEDLRPKPPIPDSQNAGPLLKELTKRYNALPEAEQSAWDKTYDTFAKTIDDPVARAAFQESLVRHADLMTLAERITTLPYCDLAYDWSLGPKLEFPELAITRRFGRLLAARAWLARDASSAWADISRCAKLGNLIGQTPCIIAVLVSVAVHAIADKGYIAMLKRFGPSPLARETLTDFGQPPPPERYFGGEVVMGLMAMQLLREGKLRRSEEEQKAAEAYQCGSMSLFEYFSSTAQVAMPIATPIWEKQMLVFWRQAFPKIREAQQTGNYATLGPWLEEQGKRWEEDRINLPQNIMVALLFPVYAQATTKTHVYTLTQRRLRESALALSEEKTKTGSFPDSPTLPADPFSPTKPLCYRKEGKSCVLYSVGQDHTDDGGQETWKNNKLDIVVRL